MPKVDCPVGRVEHGVMDETTLAFLNMYVV